MNAKIILIIGFAVFCIACGSDDPTSNTVIKEQDNGDLVLKYIPSKSDRGKFLESEFKKIKLFETILEVVNNEYAFPFDIKVELLECGVENALAFPLIRTIFMCYELFDTILTTYENGTNWTKEQIFKNAMGTFNWIFYHEMGHMMSEIYDLPITGNEEDAVDQMATILFIDGENQQDVLNTAIYWQLVSLPIILSDSHSLNLQRFYNTLCLLYGSDPQEYAGFETQYPEMENRLQQCEKEYTEIGEAWRTLLRPWRK